MKLGKHTKWPWTMMDATFTKGIVADGTTLGEAYHTSDPTGQKPDELEANARLMSLAPFAPHQCDDPACPGDLVRRILIRLESGGSELQPAAAQVLELLKEARA